MSDDFAFKEGDQVLCLEPEPGHARIFYDAKILECVKNRKNKPEYKVKITDFNLIYKDRNKRCNYHQSIPEEYIYRLNQRHTRLQKRLQRAAGNGQNERERKRLVEEVITDGLQQGKLKHIPKAIPTLDDESSCDDELTDVEQDMDMDEGEEEEEASEEEDVHLVTIEIPDPLKRILEADCRAVKFEEKIHSNINLDVVSVLQKFMQNYASMLLFDKPKNMKDTYKPEKRIELTQEVLEGLRVIFDVLLPRSLLYKEELSHHAILMQQPKPAPVKTDEDEEFIAVNQETEEDGDKVFSGNESIELPKVVETPRRQTRQSVSEMAPEPPIITEDVTKPNKVNRILQRLGGPWEKAVSESGSASSVPQKKPRLAAHLLSSVVAPTSGRSTPVNQGPNADFIMREINEWRLLPSDVEYQANPLPCVKYGAHHLLRLFVKLSDIMTGMKIPEERKSFIISVLDALLRVIVPVSGDT